MMIEMIGVVLLFWIFSEMLLYCLVENRMDVLNRQTNLDILSDEYTKNRFKNSLFWYEKYAYIYRYRFILYSMINIILSASIPVITLWKEKVFGLDNPILIAFISTMVSIISGYLFLREPKNKWYEYRKHAEVLKMIYSNKIIKTLTDIQFLEEVEKVLSEEGNKWYSSLNKNSSNNT